jgi:hypothetical protein
MCFRYKDQLANAVYFKNYMEHINSLCGQMQHLYS